MGHRIRICKYVDIWDNGLNQAGRNVLEMSADKNLIYGAAETRFSSCVFRGKRPKKLC